MSMIKSLRDAVTSIEQEITQAVTPTKRKTGDPPSELAAAADEPPSPEPAEPAPASTPRRRMSSSSTTPTQESADWGAILDSGKAQTPTKPTSASPRTPGTPGGKLASASREELLAYIQKQNLVLKKTRAKCEALQNGASPGGGSSGEAASDLAQTNTRLKQLAVKLKKQVAALQAEVTELKATPTHESAPDEASPAAEASEARAADLQAQLDTQTKAFTREREALLGRAQQAEAALSQERERSSSEADQAEALRGEAADARAALDVSQAQLVGLQEELDTATRRLAEAESGPSGLEQEVQRITAELQAMTQDKDEQQRRAEDSQAALDTATEELQQATAELGDAQQRIVELSAASVLVPQLQPEGEGASAGTEELVAELNAVRAELSGKVRELGEAQEGATALQAAHTARLEHLEREQGARVEELQRQGEGTANDLRAQVADLEARLGGADDAAQARRELEARVAAAEGDAQELRQRLEQEEADHRQALDAAQQQLQQAAAEATAADQRTAEGAQQASDATREELASTLAQLEQAMATAQDAEAARAEAAASLAQQTANLEALQAELDGTRSSATAAQDSATLSLEAVRDELAGLAADKASLEAEHDEYVTRSKETVGRYVEDISALKAKVGQMEVQASKLESNLEAETQAHKAALERLNQATAGASQNAMLDLEIADYQRTVDSLNLRVSELEEGLDRERQSAGEKQTTIDDLQAELSRARSTKQEDESRSQKLKALLRKAKNELAEKREQVAAQELTVREFDSKTEAKDGEVQELKSQLADLTLSMDNISASRREEDMQKDMELRQLQFELDAAKKAHAGTDAELSDLKTDYHSYKVRVHSVLKQQKEQKPIEAELEATSTKLGEVEAELEAVKARAKRSEETLSEYEAEVEHLEARNDELAKDMDRLRASNDQHVSQLRSASNALEREQMDIISQLREEISDTVVRDKQRLQRLSADYEAKLASSAIDLDGLRARLQFTEQSLAEQRSLVAEAREATTTASRASREFEAPVMGRQASTSRPESVRAQSPTSPSATDVAKNVGNALIDFAGLLAGQSGPQAPIARDPETQQLDSAQKQIAHLSSLLRDSESMVDRLSEQTKLLKKELRRQETNEKRAGAELNLEYLKNIVLKFLEFSEEREHLVPVLGMLLQLTPDELQKVKLSTAAAAEAMKPEGGLSSYFQQWT